MWLTHPGMKLGMLARRVTAQRNLRCQANRMLFPVLFVSLSIFCGVAAAQQTISIESLERPPERRIIASTPSTPSATALPAQGKELSLPADREAAPGAAAESEAQGAASTEPLELVARAEPPAESQQTPTSLP